MDALHSALKWVDHNRYKAVALIIGLSVACWLVGCQPMTESVLNPGTKVNAAEFEYEVAALEGEIQAQIAQIETGRKDLERQVEMRAEALEVLGGVVTAASTGALTPQNAVGSAMSLLGLFGLGAFADKRRLDKKLEKEKKATA